MAKRRLLSVGHSYTVDLNRRLANEMALAGNDSWEVTAVAPNFIHGDMRPIVLEVSAEDRCQLEPVPLRFSKSVHLMLYGRRLRSILDGNWDLVHSWEEPYILAGGQIAKWTPRNTPLVFFTLQNIAKRYPPPFRWVERYCLDRCSGWLAGGHTVVDALLPRGYGSKPHRVVKLGVDVGAFFPSVDCRNVVYQELDWSRGGPPVIGYLGRFETYKGIPLLMDALDQVKSQWRALFVGKGPLEGAMREWAKRYPGRVAIVTNATHSDVPRYINTMDLLCAPSQTTSKWKEQLGRMLIEAFACAVPVLGSDSGEIPYTIGDAGRIAPEASVEHWAREIEVLIQSPQLRAELGQAGRDRACTEFSWSVVARRHLDYFDKLLSSNVR